MSRPSDYPGFVKRMASRKRGKLTPEEKAEIDRLAATLKKPTVGIIAGRLNRLPATINWYMLSHGLIERVPGRAPGIYVRNGITVHPYAPEHDEFIETLRAQTDPKLTLRAIAEKLTAEFGIPRDFHSVQVRLVQLAAAPDSRAA